MPKRRGKVRPARAIAPRRATAKPVRPGWPSILGFVVAFAALWVASLAGIFAVLQPMPRLGAAVLVADLVGSPLLLLFWTHASVSSELRFDPLDGASGDRFALRYYVPGRGGGAWLSVVRPRLLLRTKAVLLVATAFGPRLLPRFVERAGAAPEELGIEQGAVTLTIGSRGRVIEAGA